MKTDRLRRVGRGARSLGSGRFVVLRLGFARLDFARFAFARFALTRFALTRFAFALIASTLFASALSAQSLSCSDAASLRLRASGAGARADTSVKAVAGTIVLLRSDAGRDVPVAVPIDSTAGATISVRCASPARADSSVTLRVASRPGPYRQERLRVAPRFSAPPDSALAARMAEEARRSADVSRRSRETPAMWSGPFTAPRPSRITSPFGSSRVFNDQLLSRHMGLDFAGAVGAPVRAIGRGIVRLVDRFYLGGNVVYVDHGDGLVSAYLHLSRARVAEGDTVVRGALIGDVGATGRVTGPHLHLIVRLDSITVDPGSVIGKSLGR